MKGRGNLLETIRAEPWRADWWIDVERRRGRTFRIGESFEALREAAVAPGGIAAFAPADGGQLPLPCFCSE